MQAAVWKYGRGWFAKRADRTRDAIGLLITFVVPIFNEENTLEPLVEAIGTHCAEHRRQVILVDDGSVDGSRERVDVLAAQREEVVAVHFEGNEGKTAALLRGFSMATGDVVFTLDADLQDDPMEIPHFLAELEKGYDLVCGWKSVRHDPLSRRLLSRCYNGLVGRIFGLALHDVNCGFKAMKLDVAKSLDLRHDYHRLIPVLAASCGYRVGEIEVRHHARRFGKSKYGLERYWKGLRDVVRLRWELRGTRGDR